MLQIASGKFFDTSDEFRTVHRGTLYTNYLTVGEGSISTSAGSLFNAVGFGGLSAFNYEILERIEGTPANGVLISTGGTELVEDFVSVISFALNIVCHPDPDLVRRLTGPTHGEQRRRNHPRSYLRRVFDVRLTPQQADADEVNRFIKALIGLRRNDYERVIRAIRRYVTATHRIVDETNLAYALFVMAIEALAQSPKPPIALWPEYDEEKRKRIDHSLRGVPYDQAQRVRAAILKNEHIAIARKFRAFTIGHLSPSFFREEAVGCIRPIARPDLTPLLKRAYDLRSAYVHRLEDLPKLLLPYFDLSETAQTDDLPTLTFEGLARLVRHVIFQFVERRPKVEKEDFLWRSALPNIINVPFDPRYWIGVAEQFEPKSARFWLQSFLGQVSTTIMNREIPVSDLSKILDKIEILLSRGGVKSEHRRPMIALYELFNRMFPTKQERPLREILLKRFIRDFEAPSIEELSVYLVTRERVPWSLDELDELYMKHYAERSNKNHLKLGNLLELIFTLDLAEWHRQSGHEDRARELIAFAVEANPGHERLRALERSIEGTPINPINMREVLDMRA
jgi:hypothetical protein